MTDLHALSPLDGRYAETTAPLRDYFSEFAFLRDRVRVELNFLLALSKTGLIHPLSDSESAQIESILSNFSDADAKLILEHERKTRHDVKAVEYFIQNKLQNASLEDLIPWIHFGLTSEDTNSIGQAIALKESRDKIILPNLQSLISNLSAFALQYKSTPMLARTHGQFAVPTTLGKEFVVYIARLKKTSDEISAFRFEA
ncbi:MAG: lyase family protein, partial [Anaerolineales bacterium]